jgi:hypothetical protein
LGLNTYGTAGIPETKPTVRRVEMLEDVTVRRQEANGNTVVWMNVLLAALGKPREKKP